MFKSIPLSIKFSLLILLTLCLMNSCQVEKVKKPRPRIYPKVNYPEQSYSEFSIKECSMLSFDMPKYSSVTKETHFFNENPGHPCWFDINLGDLNGTIHCSYSSFSGNKQLSKLIHDAFTITEKHNIKANYRQENILLNEDKALYGLLFEVDGQVASPIQFYLTDSTQHFFRASLYFNSKVNQDSIAPVLDFVKKDVYQMIESFEWN